VVSALALVLSGCSTNHDVGQLDGSARTLIEGGGGAACGRAPGCACAKSGELATCTVYEQKSGNYTTCQSGTMVCKDGVWGGCAGPASAQKLVLSATGIRADDYGVVTVCPSDPCDPSGDAGDSEGGVTVSGCNQVEDTPDGLDAGPNFTISDAGLTPVPNLTSEAGIACTGLAVNPPALNLVVTGLSPIVTTPTTANFTATYVPSACYAGVANAAWSVDRRDLAAISGGVVTLVSGVAGPLNVSAYSSGFQATSVVNVTTNVLDTSQVTPAVAGQFVGNGTAADNLNFLYPYANTVFPRSVAAPTVQWDNLGVAATAVKVTIQYPATGTPIYTVAQVLPESTPPQAALSQDGWAYLDQTAAGEDALITVQRLVGGVLLNPVSETVHFGTTPLRGNIFYTEYDVNAWTATIKSAKPFGTTPSTVALANSGCNPCHSVSANGSTLIASNWGNNDTSVAQVNADGTLTGLANMWNVPSPPASDSRGFAYSAISPDGQLALQGTNWWGNTVPPGSTSQTASAPHGNGSGLSGAYYANTTQAGSPAFTETDTTIDFNWGNASPGGAIAAGSTYSVAWTGYVQAIFNETYTFEVESSDGAALTVNGQVLVNQLGVQADSKHTGTIAMTAGTKVPITLVYQNLSNTSQVHLRWQSPSQPYEIVQVTQLYPATSAAMTSTGLYGTYYNNITDGVDFDPTTVTPTASRLDPTVNFNWNGAAPISGVGGDYFGASWNGQVQIPCTGSYSFCITGDDGVRLWIDGALVDNGWNYQGPTQYCPPSATAYTAGSLHTVRMDYFQGGGGSVAYLQWNSSCAGNGTIPTGDLIPSVVPPPPTNGLSGTYYSNIDFTGAATSEIDPTVNFNWNGSSPATNIGGDNWSAEWTGQIQIPCTDNYQFCVVGDDGVRLWIDGNLVDDGWVAQGPTTYCDSVSGTSMAETAGTMHDVKMDYFQAGGGSVAQLEWVAGCVGGSQIIPQANLFPTGDQGTGGYNIPFHNAGDLGTGYGYSILELPTVVGASPVDVTGPTSWGLGTTAMMAPAFSPDGTKLVFVDGDTTGGATWRQGLSFFNFNEANQAFSNRTSFVNTVKAANIVRWPTFESDSRSVIYQTNPTSQDDLDYGGMLPSGYSSIPGQLWSADTSQATPPVSLDGINAGLGGIDSNLSYQATMLPAAEGGYRWTVFTSDRQYGNTQNVPGSGSVGTDQLWVGALDDAVSAGTDRSHPPFWLPNQVLGDNGGRIRNERAYWVLDACKPSLANLNPPGGTTPPAFTWMDQDIGTPGDPAIAGSAMASGGAITITAGGDDIWNQNDAFHYAYVPVSGDFQFVARVTRLDWADYWSKGGIMLRDNLASDSAFAHMMINAGGATGYQWRTPTGNSCDWTPGPTANNFPGTPYWLRLTRSGTVVTADGSQDGVTWTNVGTLTPAIGSNAYVGLAVTAHNNGTFTTATFDNVGFVSVTGTDPRPGSVCQDDQDCCDALTSPATAACEVDVPLMTPVTRHCILLSGNSCVALGSSCVSDADCCGFPTNHCNTKGVCAVPPPPFPYGDTVFTRDYAADCPVGMAPAWHFFDWQSITPADSDIKFLAATAATAALLPATIGAAGVVPLGEASGAPVTTWGTGADVWAAMKAAGQQPSLQYLRIFADFQPTSDGTQVPTLVDWRQQYDCQAAE
jgi:regulation of enolase protein 1 (concanavalin A-like superfamily)